MRGAADPAKMGRWTRGHGHGPNILDMNALPWFKGASKGKSEGIRGCDDGRAYGAEAWAVE
eukprot:6180785-Pleurochrysis_carterae.AAC.1